MYSMLMSLVYSINVCQIRRIILKGKIAQEGRDAKWGLREWQQEVQQGRNFRYLLLVNQNVLVALKT